MPLLAAAFFLLSLQDQPQRADCREWHECRQMALDAAAAGEFERFHDFAWRTVQTGPKNDPALMYLLARAQSLSGRPADALVMLQRLAAMGVPTDAATNDDFRRVRNLSGWAEFTGGAASTGEAPKSAEPPKPVAPSKAAEPARVVAEAATTKADAGDPFRFETLPFTPAGLAYDAVSRRFIVGDRRARRLAVVDEFSRHVANLASAQSAGFGDIAAIEIDSRQGDLWVVSGDGSRAMVHKLQLVSGRALASYVPSDRFGAVDLVDIAATPDNGVLVLDRAGHRLLQVRPKSAAIELIATLPDDQPTSVAPAGNDAVYVAHAAGISRIDLPARSVTEIKPAKGIDLKAIAKLRSYKGSLIAVRRGDDGAYQAVRITLDRQGRGAASVEPLAGPMASVDPTAMTIAGGTLYYLAAADESAMTLRKLPLK
jgi:hypothetical protein